jgi:hypothetical protein
MRLVVLLAAAVLAPLTAHALPMPPREISAPVVVKLERWRTRWVIPMTVAGTERRYLLDTGGGLTLVSNATLAAAGCVPWGRTTGFNMFGEKGQGPRCEGIGLEAAGLTLTPASLGPIEMGKLNPRDAALDGIVALDAFDGRIVTIDFAGGTLTIETAETAAARTARMTPLPVRLKREVDGLALAVMAVVPSARGKLYFELDSGNGGTILASKPIASLVGLDPAKEGRQRADFPLVGDVRVVSDDALTPDLIMDGNLGMPFLRDWTITLDLKEGRAWLGKPRSAGTVAAPPAATPA